MPASISRLKMGKFFILLCCIALLSSIGCETAPENPNNPPPNDNQGQNDTPPGQGGPEVSSPPPPPGASSTTTESSPDLLESFSMSTGLFFGYSLIPGGNFNLSMSHPEALDQKAAELLFPGHPEYSAYDYAGPLRGVHLESNQDFSYGTFQMRIKSSSCPLSLDEGVVYGLFTYWHGGGDENGNGIEDNSEIDIEILCAEPEVLYLTIWTDYSDEASFLKVTRKINLKTGHFWQTTPGQEGSWGLGSQGNLPFSFSDFTSTDQWLDLGFSWNPQIVQYFLYRNNQKYILWNYSNPSHIPTHPARFLMNVWHNAEHWHNDQPADFPNQNATLHVDQFSYWQN